MRIPITYSNEPIDFYGRALREAIRAGVPDPEIVAAKMAEIAEAAEKFRKQA